MSGTKLHVHNDYWKEKDSCCGLFLRAVAFDAFGSIPFIGFIFIKTIFST